IDDMTDLYLACLQYDDMKIDGKIYNAGYENHTVGDIAEMVRDVVGKDVEIVTTPSDDLRSYHVSSEKMKNELGFVPTHTIADAVQDLMAAFKAGKISDPMSNENYYNIKTMQDLGMK
ncbi:MAG: SDR family NAD-dependent epimerase/dehydratase, partial [Alphaproteobacteria bacterium]|nr:SDR family NAD-dependent epimerase/dehydratase [Alphaproteobacteria bacterium]